MFIRKFSIDVQKNHDATPLGKNYTVTAQHVPARIDRLCASAPLCVSGVYSASLHELCDKRIAQIFHVARAAREIRAFSLGGRGRSASNPFFSMMNDF
jgi:hypothetical protein